MRIIVDAMGGDNAPLEIVKVSIAVHDTVAHILRIPQGGNHRKHPLLLPEFQMGLEAHQIVDGPLTAIGALGLYVSDETVGSFQPMNINFGIITPLDHRVKALLRW